MKRFVAFAPLLALALVIFIAAALLMRPNLEAPTFSEGMIGRPAPAYALARLDGGEAVTDAGLRGRPYLINVFASWCAPCRAEHPLLMGLRARGVAIVGVDYKDEAEAGARFLGELGDPFHAVGRDPEGRFGLELGITGVPETFVVGADGKIRAVHRGPLTQEAIENEIAPALAAP